jgi:3-phosphoshikimate 1-carboxyvinyltransferase
MTERVLPVARLRPTGPLAVPGDKSVSHRALILGALADGITSIRGLLDAADVRSTRGCLAALGVGITGDASGAVDVRGVGLGGLRAPADALDCGDSGTTLRLLAGVLAGHPFRATLTGDASLRRRPMGRVADPLRRMGASVDLDPQDRAPMTVQGRAPLAAVAYDLPVASAQVKSAILLAGLHAAGRTVVGGRVDSRDHTERLLRHFGVPVETAPDHVAVTGGCRLRAAPVRVPGDPSSAAFLLAAGAMIPGGSVEIRDVLLGAHRTGFLRVLERMGAGVEIEVTGREPEDVGTIRVSFAPLRATGVDPSEVPSLVDEIPVLAMLATAARGTTVIRGAAELRVKESDRIEAIAANLRALGVEVATSADGLAIRGPQRLRSGTVDAGGDHRIAMAFAVGALAADGPVDIAGAGCVDVSWPGFFGALRELAGGRS